MEEIHIVLGIAPNQLLACLLLTAVITWAYDLLVVTALEKPGFNEHRQLAWWQRVRNRNGMTVWEVVAGTSIVIMLFTVGIDNLLVGIILMMFFIAGGIPMIRGSYRRGRDG